MPRAATSRLASTSWAEKQYARPQRSRPQPVFAAVYRRQLRVAEPGGHTVVDDAATGHADDAIGKAPREFNVVHVDDDRNAFGSTEFAHEGHDFDRGLGIERR